MADIMQRRFGVRTLFALLVVLLSVLVSCGGGGDGSPSGRKAVTRALDNWHTRNPLPTAEALMGIVYGNGTFVAVGDQGAILTSPDGIRWTERKRIRGAYRITFGKGLFMITAYGDVWTSPNGIAWKKQSPFPVNFSAIQALYSDGIFIALGHTVGCGGAGFGCSYAGLMFTSSDGSSWTEKRLSFLDGFSSGLGSSFKRGRVAYGNGIFVVIEEGGSKIFTSTDGDTWTQSVLETSSLFSDITFGNGLFVVVGNGGLILTSPDGNLWAKRMSGTESFLGIEYLDGNYITWTCNAILKSFDAIIWNQTSFDRDTCFHEISFGEGTFVAVGPRGLVITSPDAKAWTLRSSVIDVSLNNITFGNDMFIAVGDSGVALSSPDGITWTERPTGSANSLNGITYGNGSFVAIGESGTALSSPDGITWTRRTTGSSNSLNAITYGNSTFVAVGERGVALSSPDGITWTQRTTGIDLSLRGIAYGNGLFIAVGDDSAIITSHDVIAWQPASVKIYDEESISVFLSGIAYGNGMFVSVGDSRTDGIILNGITLISADEISWSWSEMYWPFLSGITYGVDTFVAVGSSLYYYPGVPAYGAILSSSDGVSWPIRDRRNFLHKGVAYGNNTFVVVCKDGTIFQSDAIH